MKVKLEHGKQYRTVGGQRGVVTGYDADEAFPFEVTFGARVRHRYSEDGKTSFSETTPALDIVEEVSACPVN